jgi:hypothetical protein
MGTIARRGVAIVVLTGVLSALCGIAGLESQAGTWMHISIGQYEYWSLHAADKFRYKYRPLQSTQALQTSEIRFNKSGSTYQMRYRWSTPGTPSTREAIYTNNGTNYRRYVYGTKVWYEWDSTPPPGDWNYWHNNSSPSQYRP